MDAHHNEYLAAIAAMPDHTPLPLAYQDGDHVAGISAGRHWSGVIQQQDGDRVVIEACGAWLSVSRRDITHRIAQRTAAQRS